MNSFDDDEARECLNRAGLITDRLRAAKSLTEIATEIYGGLSIPLFRRRLRKTYGPETKVYTTSTTSEGKTVEIPSEYTVVTITRGGLRGKINPKDLIAELVAAYVATQSSLGKPNPKGLPSFAFFVAGLSAVARTPDLNHDLTIICEAARDEATKLAAAAVRNSHAETLGDMQRGIEAVGAGIMHSTLSRHVAAALQARNHLQEESGAEPFKGQVRREVIRILKNRNIRHYPEDDSARWRDVFVGSGLSHLKQERAGQAKSGNKVGL